MSGYRRTGARFSPRVRGEATQRQVRSRLSLPVFASVACLGLVSVMAAPPAVDDPVIAAERVPTQAQAHSVAADVLQNTDRDAYSVTKPPPPKPAVVASRGAPAAGVPDPGTAKAIAYDMVMARGWGQGEYDCLVSLWNKESGWNVYAHNRSSGAYGIPQALPGSKMATAGADWATNPATQITWGLGYISGRYGTPCGAWGASQTKGWY